MRSADSVAAEESMYNRLQTLEEEWRARTSEEVAQAVKLRSQELEIQFRDSMDIVEEKHAFKIKDMKRECEHKIKLYQDLLEEEKATAINKAKVLETEHNYEIDVIKAEQLSAIKDLGDDHQMTIKLLKADYNDKSTALTEKHELNVNELIGKHKSQIDELNNTHVVRVENLTNEWEEKMRSKIEELAFEKSSAIETLRISLMKSHKEETDRLNEKNKHILEKERATAKSLQDNVDHLREVDSDKSAVIQARESTISSLNGNVAKLECDLEVFVLLITSNKRVMVSVGYFVLLDCFYFAIITSSTSTILILLFLLS